MTASTWWTPLRQGLRWSLWYAREVLGENDYDKYVAHLGRHHPDRPPASRRQFERARMQRLEREAGARCC